MSIFKKRKSRLELYKKSISIINPIYNPLVGYDNDDKYTLNIIVNNAKPINVSISELSRYE